MTETTMTRILGFAQRYAQIRRQVIEHAEDTEFTLADNAIESQVSAFKALRETLELLHGELESLFEHQLSVARTSDGLDVTLKHGEYREQALGAPITETMSVRLIYTDAAGYSESDGDEDLPPWKAHARIKLTASHTPETEFTVWLDAGDIDAD